MKTVALKELQTKLSEYCERSQTERVLITRNGKPFALLIGVKGHEIEDVLAVSSPDFWRMVEERRGHAKLSEAELERKLASGRARARASRAKSKRAKRAK